MPLFSRKLLRVKIRELINMGLTKAIDQTRVKHPASVLKDLILTTDDGQVMG